MSQIVRVIVVNTDEAASAELRSFLLSIEGVKIVAEVEEPAMLEQALNQFPAEVLLLHLDPVPDVIMQIAAPLIEARKDRVAAIAMTEDKNAELVVRAMRAGMREFLWKPFNPEQLAEVLRRVGGEVREKKGTSSAAHGKLITLFGTLGGVGATTLATNLAVELSQLHEPENGSESRPPSVAIVDLEFHFGQVATYLDAQPSYTIAELCETTEQLDRAMIDRAMIKHPTGIHILARPMQFGQAEQITAAHCAGVLAALQEHYQYIVVDGLKRVDALARSVFQMTDINVLVIQMLVPSVRNADRVIHDLRQIGFNMDRLRLVCNRFGRETGYLEPADVESSLSRKIDWYVMDDWKTSSTAVNMGAPLFVHAPKSKLRAAYRQIASALVQGAPRDSDLGPAGAEQGSRKSLFSFFGG